MYLSMLHVRQTAYNSQVQGTGINCVWWVGNVAAWVGSESGCVSVCMLGGLQNGTDLGLSILLVLARHLNPLPDSRRRLDRVFMGCTVWSESNGT